MTEGRDKYAERRAARRAAAEPTREVVPPERPPSLQLALIIWMIIGVPLIIALIGIVIVVAAVNLRSGYRGARIWLTFFGAGAGYVLVQNLVLVVASDITASGALFLVISTVLSGAMVVATWSMWRAEVSEYMRILREGR